MCGFLGSITFKEISNVNFEKYNKRIECRGPDEKVVICNKNFVNPDTYHNYTFNRLSIIDLSKNASQPMQSDEFNSLIFLFNTSNSFSSTIIAPSFLTIACAFFN